MNIYLAGPDVFLPNADEIGRQKVALCKRYGAHGFFPLDNAIDLSASDASRQIFHANEAMMNHCDIIIANLTPFRGPSADAGTVFELGYMAGHGKLCFGYCNDPTLYLDRVRRMTEVTDSEGPPVDANGLSVENFGLADNLMMIHALDLYGAPMIVPREAPDDLWQDLTSFEACLKLAASY
ncbi:nucleoside 2-deoxyribosyltransferase [Tardiphaga sp. P9-11]|jgi:nucleoside 2-deoxyribosyltransferase|uniref:nucleoside 2-deoxyribosyltransferase n=1 Tax=Tardiphaga sp. P9-11 TaxID=2024614 RepID=UPI0011F10AC5|nr:nucleoside 2-deoxyribosyltransferase [Tardiphaga sp. P9-11]KAA0071512.1 nucleoside 2-deoxyribosyltransferase [Tardiphaga sp. P9-11]